MIVDTSAIIAILKSEPDADRFKISMTNAQDGVSLSAASYLEAAIVIDKNRDATLSERLDVVLESLAVTITPVTESHAKLARAAYRQYGKGSGHAANLNFGDCFSYALAIERGEPLLFKGNDFGRTDVAVAD